MTDIVKYLRDTTNWFRSSDLYWVNKAADEIERLRAERDEFKEALRKAWIVLEDNCFEDAADEAYKLLTRDMPKWPTS